MVQSEVTPPIVAGVCDPGDPTTTGLTEAGYNACPVVARAQEPKCYPKTSAFEPCRNRRCSLPNTRAQSSSPHRQKRLSTQNITEI